MQRQRRYSPEFKEHAIKLCDTVREHRSIKEVARQLDVPPTTLQRWVRQAEVASHDKELSASEREHLRRLRIENEILKEELEILKKAEAFFARMGRSTRR